MNGDSNYLMRILARSVEHYERFLKEALLYLPGVASVNSSFALKRVTVTTEFPLRTRLRAVLSGRNLAWFFERTRIKLPVDTPPRFL